MHRLWSAFAAEHGCEPADAWWNRVDSQMLRFLRVGITQQMIDTASQLPRTRKCSTKHLDVCWPPEMRSVVSRAVKHTSIELFLVFNELDEPRILAPDQQFSYKLDSSLFQTFQPDNVDAVRILCAHHPVMSARNQGHSFLFRPATAHFSYQLLPVFGNAALPGCFADIAVPTGYGGSLHEERPRGLSTVSWEDKLDKVFWRGTSSGAMHLVSDYDLTQVRHRHREHIYQTLRHNTSDYDIGIVEWIQCNPADVCAFLERKLGKADRVPSEQYSKYRYLLDMDGNSFSQRFVFLLRHTHSLVFKMAMFDQWETLLARPMIHYVPVNFSVDSLSAQLQWARQNRDMAHQIAQTGHDFAHSRLRTNDAACYWFRILMYYEEACLKGRGGARHV